MIKIFHLHTHFSPFHIQFFFIALCRGKKKNDTANSAYLSNETILKISSH